jgi:hypothetical protein
MTSTAKLPPRLFVRTVWVLHRAVYRVTGGRRGLAPPSLPQPGLRFAQLASTVTVLPVAASTVRISLWVSVPEVPPKATVLPSGEKSGNVAKPPALGQLRLAGPIRSHRPDLERPGLVGAVGDPGAVRGVGGAEMEERAARQHPVLAVTTSRARVVILG